MCGRAKGHGDSGAGLWSAEALWRVPETPGRCFVFFFLITAAGDMVFFFFFPFLSLFCCCFKVTSSLAF